MQRRLQVQIKGIVQGVGFRPFLFALAEEHAVAGQVLNDGCGVQLEIEGEAEAIERFLAACRMSPPLLARIETIECRNAGTPLGLTAFNIAESEGEEATKFTLLSPDVTVCVDCLQELFDPRDRRFRYPFINCTNCGPRFTIIRDVPYDRERTTMSAFPMCADCKREYHDPRQRRFHAQPNACATCGPRVFIAGNTSVPSDEVIEHAAEWISRGEIVAIKGIGGYHLACDALNDEAVQKLRERKIREDRPFALMAASVEEIRRFCTMSDAEERLLLSPARPITLLKKRSAVESVISEVVAPRQKYLGWMLAYAPLHHLLLARCAKPLVMTSGNVSDEPIAYRDEDALRRLQPIADHFLTHNREIHIRCDDSVARVFRGKSVLLRRSRGYAPQPIKTARRFSQRILACGAELKNTFCLTRENYAFLSHHIGDLENLETLRSFEEGIEHFKRLFYLEPEVVAHDLHPEYLSTKYAAALPDDLPKVGVQHHHAHIVSCLADNEALDDDEPVIGVAMDGLGFGADGSWWGGEFLIVTPARFERAAHLQVQPMPGGAHAIREPWRMAAVWLREVFGDEFTSLDLPFVKRLDQPRWRALKRMIATDLNSPQTSSMGRLFDAVASLLGLRDKVRYEGQAAIELEMIADEDYDGGGYEFAFDGKVIQPAPVIRAIVADLFDRVPTPVVAAKFHLAVADVIRTVARHLRVTCQLNCVALSGGVFQNLLLLGQTVSLLEADGFEVLTHSRVPPNDGGIALGQAIIADALVKAGKV